MASIRKKGRSFEVRIKVSGVSKSKTFATLQQCLTWARCAETELSETLKLTNHPDALPTLAQALTRYSIEVLPSSKKPDVAHVSTLASDLSCVLATKLFTPGSNTCI